MYMSMFTLKTNHLLFVVALGEMNNDLTVCVGKFICVIQNAREFLSMSGELTSRDK